MNNKIHSIIANSGIQFLDFKIDLSEESLAMKTTTSLAEIVTENDKGDKEYDLEFPYFSANFDSFIIENNINKDAFDHETGMIDDEKIKPDFVQKIEEEFVFNVKARDSITLLEGNWLPLPYFRVKSAKELHPGPNTWARVYLSRIPAKERTGKETHAVVLAFDTRCLKDNEDINANSYNIPIIADAEQNSLFSCPNNKTDLYNYCATHNCGENDPDDEDFWVLNWIDKLYNTQCKNKGIRKKDQTYYFVGIYINFIKTLAAAKSFPKVSFHKGAQEPLEVDLVLDIGNSRTCGILYQSTSVKESFSFAKAMPLEIRDLSYPNKTYAEPFDMRLAFVESNFGDGEVFKSGNPNAFTWTSLLRIGPEAKRLMTLVREGQASNTTMSSPKRYLWDTQATKYNWEFISDRKVITALRPRPALHQVLTRFFASDGRFIHDKNTESDNLVALEPKYSRSSLMTFVMVEILLNAISFVNSYKFRYNKGDEHIPRKLKRIVLTCPTAMTTAEKFSLRERAMNAALAIKESFGSNLIDDIDEDFFSFIGDALNEDEEQEDKLLPDIKLDVNQNIDLVAQDGLQVIPDPRDIISKGGTKKDWNYDEATSVQLAFIYGEITSRYNQNAKLYFEISGRMRENSVFPDEPSINIASVDIGGGTTDLMICSYQTNPKSQVTALTPDPQFWEGFNFAGDDIIKRIIERLILPPIGKYAKEQGGMEVYKAMKMMFGTESAATSAKDIAFRKQFCNQIAIPIAYGFMQHTTNEAESGLFSYESFFDINVPNPDLVDFINNKFKQLAHMADFDLRDVQWYMDKDAVNLVIRDIMEKMISELCTIISQYNCDYLLLAGRPTMLPIIQKLFLKYLPVWPGRIVKLGNYRIGEWYPFHDGVGRVKDPKTCVVVGATIALMSKLGRLDGFRLDTQLLKDKVKSTAEYIGKYDKDSSTVKNVYLTPNKDSFTIQFEGIMHLGFRQMPSESWTASPLYKLCFANTDAAERLASRLPLQVEIERDYQENKEKLGRITSIIDKDDQTVSPKDIMCVLQTLPDENGYWMDTGKFDLPIFDDF